MFLNIAMQLRNMFYKLVALGLGTCYIAAFKPDKAREFLKLSDSEEPVLFTPLGYGNAEPRDTPRKEIDEFTVYL